MKCRNSGAYFGIVLLICCEVELRTYRFAKEYILTVNFRNFNINTLYGGVRENIINRHACIPGTGSLREMVWMA
ncbi:MAG: hypothetical protein ABI472_22100 [Ginsengibacter sp.]